MVQHSTEETDGSAQASNGQLATPALSPISEHRHEQPLQSRSDATPDSVSKETERRAVVDGKLGPRRRSSEARTLKLSPQQIHDLTTSVHSLPLRQLDESIPSLTDQRDDGGGQSDVFTALGNDSNPMQSSTLTSSPAHLLPSVAATPAGPPRPPHPQHTSSMNSTRRKSSSSRIAKDKPLSSLPRSDDANASRPSVAKPSPKPGREASPAPSMLPIPPLSLPTYLHLELSANRPSPLYIYRSATTDFPYESSRVKFQRLLNFIQLPPQLEHVLLFGAVACLDAWLYTFTILPLRFLIAAAILLQWIGRSAAQEALNLGAFVFNGLGRVWQRQREGSATSKLSSDATTPDLRGRRTSSSDDDVTTRGNGHVPSPVRKHKRSSAFRHRRTRSEPSALLPNHKADLLQGLLIISSCTVLMWFDASRMYHSIRGQAAIKLYVIYNVLEVFDRLFSAIGQDVLECLFSKETLERDTNGRSKVLRPLWMFALALVYNVIHATALFYQVVTLNVAVNSYSNALLTLLMSNQFVEIKGTVFKKFEKENLFQLTCADVVERFQLWLMLSIIALRNMVEVGGLSISLGNALPNESLSANGTGVPLVSGFVIPRAFTLLPTWTGEVLGPFLIVLGSEALVDWCKHAYITKFNNVRPSIYARFLDVLAKDYYSHAFADQDLSKRLGLPVLPLSCLFIRACVQTYHMFLATHMPLPIPSPATGLALDGEAAPTAALQHIDHVFRRALGRSSFGAGSQPGSALSWWSPDDIIAFATMLLVFLAIYLVLLACKLLLGMALLSYARSRYRKMNEREREREHMGLESHARRVGGWGTVEVGDEARKRIYEDDEDGLRELERKERRSKEKAGEIGSELDGIKRYGMVGKRIW